MSKPTARPRPPTAIDGGTPIGPMTLSGVVKTTRGYAVATATFDADGNATVKLGNSQAYPEHVAAEHKRILVNATLAVQVQR